MKPIKTEKVNGKFRLHYEGDLINQRGRFYFDGCLPNSDNEWLIKENGIERKIHASRDLKEGDKVWLVTFKLNHHTKIEYTMFIVEDTEEKAKTSVAIPDGSIILKTSLYHQV